MLPSGLALGAVSAVVIALAMDQHPTAVVIGDPQSHTPVLSARRTPEVIAAPVGERRLVSEFEAWIPLSPPDSCLVVERSGSRQRLFAHNERQSLAGASTQKLVTATALLLAYGPNARLETMAAASDPVSDGILAGDLYLIGGGDPLLATPEYAEQLGSPEFLTDASRLADAIAEAGIRHIEGSVTGDESRYDSARFHPVWPDRFRPQNVAGPVGALNVSDGVMGFPKDGRLGSALVPPPDPAEYAAAVVTELLRKQGVTVDGAPQSGPAPDDAVIIATLESVPMREITAEMVMYSDNQTAEMAFKELGVRELGEGSWDAGAVATENLLNRSGVSLDGVEIVDGSGLSTQNRITCDLLVDLLNRPDTGPVLLSGLAVAGQSGTLSDRWTDSPIEGRLRAKTGSVRTVSALAGQAAPAAGGPLTFAYVATVPDPQLISDAQVALQDSLAEILTTYPRDVDLTALLPANPPGREG